MAVSDGDANERIISNISLGGAFVDLDERLSIGTRVQVEFSIPGRPEPITVGAAVRWVAPTGSGVQFDGLRAGEVWSLNQYFETLS